MGVVRNSIMKSRRVYPWRGEVCKRCLRPNYVGYELTDEGWVLITRGLWNILCIPCLDDLSKKEGIDWVPYLVGDLYPCSSIGWSED